MLGTTCYKMRMPSRAVQAGLQFKALNPTVFSRVSYDGRANTVATRQHGLGLRSPTVRLALFVFAVITVRIALSYRLYYICH